MTRRESPNLGPKLGRAIAYAVATLAPRAVGLAMVPIFTAHLSTEAYGRLSLAETLAGLVVTVSALGLPGSLLRLQAIEDEHRQRRIGSLFLALHLSLASGLAALVVTGPWILAHSIPAAGISPTMLLIASATASLLQLFAAFQVMRQAREQAWAYAAMAGLQSVVAAIAATILLVSFAGGVVGVLTGRLIAAAVVVVLCVLTMARGIVTKPDLALSKATLYFAVPIVFHQLVALALTAADRFIIERLIDIGAVGLYSLGYAFASVMAVMTTVVMLLWSPTFYKSVESRPQAVCDTTLSWLTLAAFVSIGAIVVGPRIIPYVIDERFQEGMVVVPLIIGGYFFHTGFSLFSLQLLHAGRTASIAMVTVWAAATNLGLNFLLVPSIGIAGAALATLVAYASEMALVFIMAQWRAPLPHHSKRILLLGTTVAVNAIAATWASKTSFFSIVFISIVLLMVLGRRELKRWNLSS